MDDRTILSALVCAAAHNVMCLSDVVVQLRRVMIDGITTVVQRVYVDKCYYYNTVPKHSHLYIK